MNINHWTEAERRYAIACRGIKTASELSEELNRSRNAIIGVWFRGKNLPPKQGGCAVTKHDFAIEKNIPVPDWRVRARYPFKDMQVGDSFLIPQGDRKKVYPAASAAGARHGKKFAVRKVDDGVRVWRVA